MNTAFGSIMKKIRSINGDSLRTCASKLEITPAFLSAMEVGRKSIPTYYLDRISNLYDLHDELQEELFNSIAKTNKHIDIEIEKMDEETKNITLLFARKIDDADSELVEKLRKLLMED